MNIGTVTVRAGTIGTFWTNDAPMTDFGASCMGSVDGINQITCSARWAKYGQPVSMPGGGPGWYRTNLPGVAIRVALYDNRNQSSGGLLVPFAGYKHPANNPTAFSVVVSLGAYGPITGGTLEPGAWVELFSSYPGPGAGDRLVITGGNIQVMTPDCTIATNNLVIQMGDWDAEQLDRTIATPVSAPQNIVLNCQYNPGVTMSVSGTLIPDQQNPNLFALTPGPDMAKNVGVQFFANNDLNTALRPNTPVAITSSAGATVNIPIQARYFKAGGKPTPGRANAAITATFSFN